MAQIEGSYVYMLKAPTVYERLAAISNMRNVVIRFHTVNSLPCMALRTCKPCRASVQLIGCTVNKIELTTLYDKSDLKEVLKVDVRQVRKESEATMNQACVHMDCVDIETAGILSSKKTVKAEIFPVSYPHFNIVASTEWISMISVLQNSQKDMTIHQPRVKEAITEYDMSSLIVTEQIPWETVRMKETGTVWQDRKQNFPEALLPVYIPQHLLKVLGQQVTLSEETDTSSETNLCQTQTVEFVHAKVLPDRMESFLQQSLAATRHLISSETSTIQHSKAG